MLLQTLNKQKHGEFIIKKTIRENPQLIQKIVDLLSPHMEEDNRRAILIPYLRGYDRLYSKIDWSGSARNFTTELVDQLITYGKIEQGEQALSVVLRAVRGEVGVGDQKEIDELLQLMSPIEAEAIDEPNPVAPVPIKGTAQNALWKYIGLLLMAIVLLWLIYQSLSLVTDDSGGISQGREGDAAPILTSMATIETAAITEPETASSAVTEIVSSEAIPTVITSTATLPTTVTPKPTSTPITEITATIPPETATSTTTATATIIPFTSTPEVGTTRQSPNDGATYMYVPKGKFVMGSTDKQIESALDICDTLVCPRSRFTKEQPQKEIYLDSFWIMQTEVTVEQYSKFMEAGGYTNQAYWSEEGWSWKSGFLGVMGKTEPGKYWNNSDWNKSQQPVISVSWFEAEAYANWLSAETGLTYNLPTEAQWEKAARGTEGLIFPWGNIWDTERANSGSQIDGYEQTAPVGSFLAGASPYGAFDMAGNVFEWTLDRYHNNYYEEIDSQNPVSLQDSNLRTVRGGTWNSDPSAMRTTYRYGFAQNSRFTRVGFRLVMLSPDFGE